MTDQEMFDNLTEGVKQTILEAEAKGEGGLLRSIAITAYLKGRDDEEKYALAELLNIKGEVI